MRKQILLLLMAAVPFVAFCQGKVHYAYDSAGNRVRREIVVSARAAATVSKSSPEYYSETLSDKEIRIYPNPTKGHLKVEVAAWEAADQGTLRLHNAAGQAILTKRVGSSFTELDISSRPNGLYVLQITLNGKTTSWKIMKK